MGAKRPKKDISQIYLLAKNRCKLGYTDQQRIEPPGPVQDMLHRGRGNWAPEADSQLQWGKDGLPIVVGHQWYYVHICYHMPHATATCMLQWGKDGRPGGEPIPLVVVLCMLPQTPRADCQYVAAVIRNPEANSILSFHASHFLELVLKLLAMYC